MSTQPNIRLTPEEYLAIERAAEYKSEYFDGEVFPMPGASRRHNLISMNVGATLNLQLKRRPCEVYPSDMRVKIPATGLYTYPDVVVVCGEPQFEDAQVDTLLNPTLLVEVLSESTEGYDRGKKSENYRTLPSLMEYLLIAQEKYHVEHYARQADNRWLLTETKSPADTLHLAAISCELALTDIYDKVMMAESKA